MSVPRRLATCQMVSPSSASTSLPSRRNFTDLPAPLPAVIAKSSSCACALPSPLWGGVGGGVLRQCSPALLAEFPHPRFVASSSRRYSRTGGRGSLAIATKMFSAHHKGTSNNCHQSSGAPNLPANDSALFSFRFYAVHPKDVRDCQLRQLFEVPINRLYIAE